MSGIDHERVASESPAWPGDVIDYGDGYRKIVRYASLRHRMVRPKGCTCGGCLDDEYEYEVYVDADEPTEAIAKGGGTVVVLPIEKLHDDWPPSKAQVWRDGRVVYPSGGFTDRASA